MTDGNVKISLEDEIKKLKNQLVDKDKQIEELKKNQFFYHAVADSTIMGISLVDSKEKILYTNAAFAKMVGVNHQILVRYVQKQDWEGFLRELH